MGALYEGTEYLWAPRQVPRLDGPPDALSFMRDFIHTSTPCIIANAMKGPDWSTAMTAWDLDFLVQNMGDALVTVNLTPNGRGDAVVGNRFVKPHEERMSMSAFANALHSPAGPVPYLSLQNDNLRKEHRALAGHVPPAVAWFEEALGVAPAAVNLCARGRARAPATDSLTCMARHGATGMHSWVGDDRATTSVHSDLFENLYCVIGGLKRFVLFPPTDPIGADLAPRRPARYVLTDGVFAIAEDQGAEEVPWISLDPTDAGQLPTGSVRLHADVSPGEMLYIPSHWYHHVQQAGTTIAVNYWYAPAFPLRAASGGACESRCVFEPPSVRRGCSPPGWGKKIRHDPSEGRDTLRPMDVLVDFVRQAQRAAGSGSNHP